MGEKWFQFVSRIKKETGVDSLKKAMKIASKRKSEWKKDGGSDKDSAMGKTGKKMRKTRGRRGTRKMRK